MNFLHNISQMLDRNLDRKMQNHLKNVYASIAAASLMMAMGTLVHYEGYFQSGILSSLGTLILICMVILTRDHTGKDDRLRLACLYGFAFFFGISIGPIIKEGWKIDTVIFATLITLVVFTCFSLSALVATQGKYLALFAPLSAALLGLLLVSLLNTYIKSLTVTYVKSVAEVLVMSAFILYDTHLIMEKFRKGDEDYVWHALYLFVDLITVFKEVLVILLDKAKRKNQRNLRR